MVGDDDTIVGMVTIGDVVKERILETEAEARSSQGLHRDMINLVGDASPGLAAFPRREKVRAVRSDRSSDLNY